MLRSKHTFCGLLIAIFFAAPALAQGTKVALVDISMIFQQNQRFAATMDLMKKEIEKFEDTVKARRNQLKTKGDALKSYNAGSPEYRSGEASLAKESADLQVDIGLKKKEIMDREARVYHEAYNEVIAHVTAIARQQKIGIVLRYNSAEINPNERNSVLAGVNRSIIYQNQLDITNLVLKSINGQQPARTTQPRTTQPRVSAQPGFPPRK